MSLVSMTGYGRGSAAGKNFRVSVDMRSVNGRFLEVRSKLPKYLLQLEVEVRSRVAKIIRRGMVDISINVQPLTVGMDTNVDHRVMRAFAKEVEAVSSELGIPSGLSGMALLRLPGVVLADDIVNDQAETEISALALEALGEAIAGLLEMRQREGEKLKKVLERELAEIRTHRDWVVKHREEINSRYRARLEGRIKEWTSKSQIALDESRMQQEVVFYLDRGDIAEELDRLTSHMKQWEQTMQSPEGKTAGKRLDFLAQELVREVNTIGSKSDLAEVTNHVVEMKLSLERMREQVQNLE